MNPNNNFSDKSPKEDKPIDQTENTDLLDEESRIDANLENSEDPEAKDLKMNDEEYDFEDIALEDPGFEDTGEESQASDGDDDQGAI